MEKNWKEELTNKFCYKNTDKAVIHGYRSDLVAFISSLLQEQRQRMAKEIEGKANDKEDEEFRDSDDMKTSWFYRGKQHGLQAALKIVLGEDNN